MFHYVKLGLLCAPVMQVSGRSSSERELRRLNFHLIALIVKFWITLMAFLDQPHKSVKPSLFFSLEREMAVTNGAQMCH